jgi:MEMO1 family protein
MSRPAFLAGRWYPGDADSCRAAIEAHAARAAPITGDFRGLIGPHAGWAYSGDCAARGYTCLASRHADAELVVIFGSHRGPSGPNTIFRSEAWQTPLGPLAVDRELTLEIASALGLDEEPEIPMRPDNAVELHLPFVRHFFPTAEIVMMGVAASEIAIEIGRRAGELARAHGKDAVFIGSTDLTHYGPSYDFSPAGGGERAVAWVRDENDGGFVRAILEDDTRGALAHARDHRSACCPGAAVAAIEAARAAGALGAPQLVDHYLSYDVRPDASFVGYASIAF